MGWAEDKAKENEELKSLIYEARKTLAELSEIRKSCSTLVCAAIRQGFVNKYQEEALMIAFEKLTGEANRKLLQMLVFIQPKDYQTRVIGTKPPALNPPPREFIDPYYHDNDGA